jgi:ABC-type nitrate/sulfonate/bicarbonate transport system permease component
MSNDTVEARVGGLSSTEVSSRIRGKGYGRSRNRVKARHVLPFVAPIALLVVWELYVRWAHVDPTVLPSPIQVAKSLYINRSTAWSNTSATLQETLIGFACSVLLAVVLAVTMDLFAWLRHALYPILVASQTIPIIAIAPLMIIWFGFGILPKVLLVMLVTFFPVCVALLDGFASIEGEAIDLLQTMGATRRQTFMHLRAPNALPFFFTGVRISITYAVIASIFAEYVGSFKGLGIWMQASMNAFRTDLVFGAILISAVLSTALFALVTLVAHLTIPWYYASRRTDS